MKIKRKTKTFAENMTRSLNRQKQLQAMKKQLLQKAREHQSQRSRAYTNVD
jgi:hypothetical protein